MPQSFETVERVQELRSILSTLSGRSLTDLTEQEQDDLFFASEEYYLLTGHDYCVEPTQEAA